MDKRNATGNLLHLHIFVKLVMHQCIYTLVTN